MSMIKISYYKEKYKYKDAYSDFKKDKFYDIVSNTKDEKEQLEENFFKRFAVDYAFVNSKEIVSIDRNNPKNVWVLKTTKEEYFLSLDEKGKENQEISDLIDKTLQNKKFLTSETNKKIKKKKERKERDSFGSYESSDDSGDSDDSDNQELEVITTNEKKDLSKTIFPVGRKVRKKGIFKNLIK